MRLRLVIVGMLMASAPARAGVVQTAAGRYEGKVTIQADHVDVDGKKIGWANVLTLIPDGAVRQLGRSDLVHFKNGECWSAELVGLSDKKLEVKSQTFGAKTFDVAQLAALDFGGRSIRGIAVKPRTMYRIKAEPVTGSLKWIKSGNLMLESVIGDLELPFDSLVTYRFGAAGPRDGIGDWVYLIDGSVLLGKTSLDAKGVQFESAAGGSATLAPGSICAVVRRTAGQLDLAETSPTSFEMTSFAGFRTSKPDPAVFGHVDGLDGPAVRIVKGIALQPKSRTTFKIEAPKGGSGRLQVQLLPSLRNVGDARLTIRAGGKALLEREVTPTTSEAISVPVRSGDEVEILVEFGGQLRFPCGVVLGDPRVIWE